MSVNLANRRLRWVLSVGALAIALVAYVWNSQPVSLPVVAQNATTAVRAAPSPVSI
jgi:hypothetical protein